MTGKKCRRKHFLTFVQIKMMKYAYDVFLAPVSFNQGELGKCLQIFKGLCIVLKIGKISHFPILLL